ncbi:MAG: hypothetical protein M0P01_12285 [Treponema sp.]|nr:hypothetical protein [Treponema sp.]
MTYPETLYTALASAASGGAVFCALSMIYASVLRRSCRKSCFSAFCVLLSIVTASFALLYIFTPFTVEHLKIRNAAVWSISFFAGGLLLTAFYRILIPFAVSVYIVFVFFTFRVMRGRYPVPRSLVPVSVYKGSFTVGTEKMSLFFSPEGTACVQVNVCTLPPELLVPLPRTWYAFSESPEKDIALSGRINFLDTGVRKYTLYAAGTFTVINIPVPSGADAAAMYTVDFRCDPPVLVCVL